MDDGRWYDEIDDLLRRPRQRRKLAGRGLKWAREQMLSKNLRAWEAALSDAVDIARRASM